MKIPAKAATLALALASVAWAGGTVELQAATPTRVYLDGEYLGETPLVLSNMQPGDYQIQAEDPGTGELRTFVFHSPARVDVSKVLDVGSSGRAPVVVPAPAPVPQVRQIATIPAPAPPVYCPPVRQVVYQTPRYSQPRYWSSGTATPVAHRGSRHRRAKTHTRNTLLGLTAASQVFTGDRRDRKRYRNVGLGLMALNELLR